MPYQYVRRDININDGVKTMCNHLSLSMAWQLMCVKRKYIKQKMLSSLLNKRRRRNRLRRDKYRRGNPAWRRGDIICNH